MRKRSLINHQPLISCLMLSHAIPQRGLWFRRSVLSFVRQSYPHKELLILFNHSQAAELKKRLKWIASLHDERIVVLQTKRDWSLGKMRNHLLKRASGKLICQWDDDDVSHPKRIEKQWRTMQKLKLDASYLPECFHLMGSQRKIFCENWGQQVDLRLRWLGFPSTLMCRTEKLVRYPVQGPKANHEEDVFFYFKLLASGARIGFCPSKAPLYLYVHHGHNQWSVKHHRSLGENFGYRKKDWQKNLKAWQRSLKEMEVLTGRYELMGADGRALLQGF